MTRRQERVNALVQRLAADFLQSAIRIENVLVSVLAAEVSKDLKRAKIFVSVLPETREKEIIDLLKNQKKNFRAYLAKNLKIKYLPEPFFEIDKSERMRQRIEEILKKAAPSEGEPRSVDERKNKKAW
ncbi:MAG: 30S ribosome-binding factor RbfA [Patescibacteria group bacterium]